MSEKNFLKVARKLLMGNYIEDACAHYFKVQEENPENAEAEFFATYLGLQELIKEKKGSVAGNTFASMTENIENTVKCIKKAEFEEDDAVSDCKGDRFQEVSRLILISRMVEIYTPITRYLITNRLSTSGSTIEGGVLGLFALGDAIEKEFAGNPEFMKEAIVAWKEGISIHRMFWMNKFGGINPEDYAAKIQKVDPSYTIPKKAGCISVVG